MRGSICNLPDSLSCVRRSVRSPPQKKQKKQQILSIKIFHIEGRVLQPVNNSPLTSSFTRSALKLSWTIKIISKSLSSRYAWIINRHRIVSGAYFFCKYLGLAAVGECFGTEYPICCITVSGSGGFFGGLWVFLMIT